MNTWKEECVLLLQRLGGHAYLKDIYKEFELNGSRPKTQNYDASIRDALEKGSPESNKYEGTPLFFMVEGKNNGHYGLTNYDDSILSDITQDDDEFSEGKQVLKKHIVRERNYSLIANAKKRFKEKNGTLYCEVCGFNFQKTYGELGDDFIEAHHIKPVSEMKENELTKIEDIVMLCSNCHSMIHRRKPWLNKTELYKLINK